MGERKEILYIGGFELPDKNAAAQRVISNGKVLRDLGYDVYYLNLDRSLIKKASSKQFTDTFEGFKFRSVTYPSKTSEWLTYLFSITDITELINELPNLRFIIAYNYPAFALARLNRFCDLKNVCLIADCTEWYQPHGGVVFRVIKGIDTYFRMRVIHPKLDGVIAISKYLYEFYRASKVKVVQIPPLVDLRSDKWKNEYTSNNQDLVLVYAGSPGKGTKDRIDTIIKMLTKVKISNVKLSLHVIGLSKEQFIDDFGDDFFINETRIILVFKGRLSHTETLNEIKNADYAIFVRDINLVTTAGFPTKFVEALSCGVPILTNSYSNVADYLRDGFNGYLLDDSSEETLIKTLSTALSQGKKKIDEMKATIREEGVFDYRKYIDVFEHFLNSVSNFKSDL